MSLNRMVKDIQRGLLVSPRQEAFLKKNQGDVVISKETLDFVVAQLSTGDRDRSATFSASGRGNCLRQQLFSYLSLEGKKVYTSDQASIFTHGTWTHLKWQCMGFEAGWLGQAEVPCKIEEFELTGTIDGILDTGEGWEFKSINSRGFRNICEYGPQEKHLKQIHAYMLATGITTWSLIYEDKDTQQWREWVIPRSQEILDELLDELTTLHQAKDMKQLPDVLDSCSKREGTQFKNCPYKDSCLEMKKWPTKSGIKLRSNPSLLPTK